MIKKYMFNGYIEDMMHLSSCSYINMYIYIKKYIFSFFFLAGDVAMQLFSG